MQDIGLIPNQNNEIWRVQVLQCNLLWWMGWTEKKMISTLKSNGICTEKKTKTQIVNAKICMRPSNGKEEKKKKGYP